LFVSHNFNYPFPLVVVFCCVAITPLDVAAKSFSRLVAELQDRLLSGFSFSLN